MPFIKGTATEPQCAVSYEKESSACLYFCIECQLRLVRHFGVSGWCPGKDAIWVF